MAVVKETLMGMEPLTPGHSLFPAGVPTPRWSGDVIPATFSIEKEPLEVGSLALVVDSIQPRERWSLALVTAAPLSGDGLQRRVFLRLSNGQHLERDIRKVVLLERDGEKDGVKVVKELVRVVIDIV